MDPARNNKRDLMMAGLSDTNIDPKRICTEASRDLGSSIIANTDLVFLEDLINQWYAAAKNNIKTLNRMELFSDTAEGEKLVDRIKKSDSIEQKAELCIHFINQNEAYKDDDLELLSEWIARHTLPDLSGAYSSLNPLFQVVGDTIIQPEVYKMLKNHFNGTSLMSKLRYELILITALRTINANKKEIHLSDADEIIIDQLERKSLDSMRLVSKHFLKLARMAFVKKLNKGETPLAHYGIKSFQQLVNFLGEECCSQIIKLYQSDYPSTSCMNMKTGKPIVDPSSRFIMLRKEDIELLVKNFPNLEYLSLGSYEMVWSSWLEDLKTLTFLTTLDLRECYKLDSIDFLTECTSIKNLLLNTEVLARRHISQACTFIEKLDLGTFSGRLRDLKFLEYFPRLKSLVLPHFLANADTALQACTTLESLNIVNFQNTFDLSLLNDCIGLKNLSLQFQNITNSSVLKRFKSLENLILPNVKDVIDLSFLENGSLKSLYLRDSKIDDWSPFFKYFKQGTYTDPDGYRYEGSFDNGKLYGEGSLFFPIGYLYPNEYAKYIGTFKDNEPNGKGLLTYRNGETIEGTFAPTNSSWRFLCQGTYINEAKTIEDGTFLLDPRKKPVLLDSNAEMH